MIERAKYLNLLIKSRDNGFPKVITGIRRCGKSYLLKDIFRNYLINSGVDEKEILLIELDDEKNSRLRDPLELGEYVRKYCSAFKKCYVFLDEIQKVVTIQNPYIPQGLVDQINMQTTSQNQYNALLGLIATNFSQQKPQAKTENEDTENE